MIIACLDMEGVLVPEIWVNVAERTGIEELRLTTRNVPDYDELMRHRLKVLDEHGMKIQDIQEVIGTLKPLDGAIEMVDWLRERFQVVVLSDTFYQFAEPLMKQLGRPTLFCHNLEVAPDGRIVNYHLRQQNQKQHAVEAFQSLNFKCIATGDSYNDTTMLGQAEAGILYNPPQKVIDEFPQFPVTWNYQEMREQFVEAANRIEPSNPISL